MGQILEIRMQSGCTDCAMCGEPTEFRWGIPIYNGDPVSNDFVPPEEWRAGGVSVCEECHRRHEDGRMRTYDALYERRGPMGVALVNGAGI